MYRRIAILLIIIAAALAACSGSAPSQPLEIAVEAAGMHYQPATLEVTAGYPVKLTFHNNNSVDHDFSVMQIPMTAMLATAEPMAGHDMGSMQMDPELHMAALPGTTNTLEFTPTQPGTYEFFCTVAGHKEAGMVGTLIVK